MRLTLIFVLLSAAAWGQTFNGITATGAVTVTVGPPSACKFGYSPNPVAFGNVTNNTAKTIPVTISNTGGSNCVLSTFSSNNALFTFATNCQSVTIIPGGTCIFNLTFTPTASGIQNAIITVDSSGDTIAASGTGVPLPQPQFQRGPNPLDFGNVTVNTNKTETVTITNVGNANLVIATASCSGSPVYTTSADLCSGQTVLPNGSCTFNLTFAPTATGVQGTTCTVVSNSPTSPDMFTGTGDGVPTPTQLLTVALSGATGTALVTSSPSGVSCSPTCTNIAFTTGVTVTLTEHTPAGYTFTSWSGTGGCSGTASTTTVTMSAAESCTATFAVIPPTGVQASLFWSGFNNQHSPIPPPTMCPVDLTGSIIPFYGIRQHDSGLKWSQIEKTQGVYTWALADTVVNSIMPGLTQTTGGGAPPCPLAGIYTLSSVPAFNTTAWGHGDPSPYLPGPAGTTVLGTACSITSGLKLLTCPNGPFTAFTTPEGPAISITGAGTGGSTFTTYIATYTSANQVTVNDAAITTVSSGTVTALGFAGGTQCSGTSDFACTPMNDLNADGTGPNSHFQSFMQALMQRYPNKFQYFESWNEPDSPNFWCVFGSPATCGSSSISLARMVRIAWDYYQLMQCYSPSSKMLSVSFHGPTAATWMHNFVTTSINAPAISLSGCSVAAQTVTGRMTFDYTNFHGRGNAGANANPEAFLTVYAQAQSEISADGLPTPLMDDENGCVGTAQCPNLDYAASYVARGLILRASVTNPIIGLTDYYYADATSSNPLPLVGSIAGQAYRTVAGWMTGNVVSPSTTSGTIYTVPITISSASDKMTWDTSQNCNGGTPYCTALPQLETGFASYTDLTNTIHPLSGGYAPVGLKPVLLTNTASTNSLTNQQSTIIPSYYANANSITTKPLPADYLSHLYTNGDNIAKCAMTDCGAVPELTYPVNMGRFLKASPGSSDFANPVYYSAPSDPWYSAPFATPTGQQTIAFHCPNAANWSGGDEHEISCWDQATGWFVEFYSGSSPQNIMNLPTASGCGPTSGTACAISNTFQSAATNFFTGADYGYTASAGHGSNASNGFGPGAAMTRESELINGINHALMFTVDCVNSSLPYVFPANQSPGLCDPPGSSIFGPQNTNRISAGMLLVLDYTPAQLATICTSVPLWQCNILTAFLKYGAYISETGGKNIGLDFVGDENLESSQAWKYANPSATCPFTQGTPCYTDTFWSWLTPQKGLDGTANLTHVGCFAGNPSTGTSPASTFECEGGILANIGRLVTSGSSNTDSEGNSCGSGAGCYPSGHVRLVSTCIALGYANQPGGCF